MAVEAVMFTSFKQASRWLSDPRVSVVSAARWQPKGSRLHEVEWMAPRYPKTGQPVKLRDFGGDVEAYFAKMRGIYSVNVAHAMHHWLGAGPRFVVAACWCPYSRTSKWQIDRFGTFVCHTEPLGWALRQAGVRVEYDSDRTSRMVKSKARVAGISRKG